MSDLGKFLTSINKTKENLIRDNPTLDSTYPQYQVARSLAYAPDAIFIVNELNCLSTPSHGMTNAMHYEFLLYALPKEYRFAKWIKPSYTKNLEYIAREYRCSLEKAKGYLFLFSDEDLKELCEKYENEGGRQ